MAMKQTQTKLFAFSDAGIDICTGSRALFPDRFKRMFVQGYNVQTVSNVTVSGNQVTLTYGGSHGYAADRILKIDSGSLAAINNGEFYIDSVTTDTVVLTIDDAPLSIAGGFTTRIAPLGWQLVYEASDHVHLYKIKHKDNTDLYLRLVFQTLTNARHGIAVCVGKTADEATGFITDPFAYIANANRTDANSDLVWDFRSSASDTHANWTFSQGQGTYGKTYVVGSQYHVGFAYNMSVGNYRTNFCGLFPTDTVDYELLDYPMILCGYLGSAHTTTVSSPTYLANQRAFIGAVEVVSSGASKNWVFDYADASLNSVSTTIDSVDTITGAPTVLFEKVTRQFLGFARGIFSLKTQNGVNLIAPGNTNIPTILEDTDAEAKVVYSASYYGSSAGAFTSIVMPLEPVV